jgi:hypothetical protein
MACNEWGPVQNWKTMVKKNKTQIEKYKEIIQKVLEVCKTTGWEVYLENEDKGGKFAIFHVTKYFNSNTITGVVNITVNDGIQYSVQHTSFYSYGIENLLHALTVKFDEIDWLEKKKDKDKKPSSPRATDILSVLLKNFDKSARQLKRRYDSREPFVVIDEYDVQDLLHCLLRAYFDDVRPEEYTPSYAGSASRVDFLLKEEKVVIEAKFATAKLKGKEIGNQLIIDIKRYQSHPNCKYLFCLVYDPDTNINNPSGIEKDLSKIHDGMEVKVFVVPH